MKLNRLKLENFRNHGSYELDLTEPGGITYLVGPNASGKTNILEAIYILALIKSFRGQGAEDLIGWGGRHCRVTAEISGSTEREDSAGSDEAGGDYSDITKLEVFLGIPPNPRQSFKVNGVKKSAADFIGNCRVVLFHPEDLNMLYLGPDLRRRYLDMLNIQADRRYYRALSAYRRILKQRNSLLKNINEGYASKDELEVWDGQLAESGATIIAERKKTVDFLNNGLGANYRGIAGNDDTASVSYRASAGLFAGATATPSAAGAPGSVNGATPAPADEPIIKKTFLNALKNALQTDLRAEVTTVGPHRDELEFILNGRPLATHASRGEYRSILLAMKLLEIEYLRTRSGTDPILLLDDVFSELDPERQKQLTEAIGGAQTIITASHPDDNIIARSHRSLVQVTPSARPLTENGYDTETITIGGTGGK